nr:uncharacterized protein LOC111502124 [Leptinotarsa decemlineata]
MITKLLALLLVISMKLTTNIIICQTRISTANYEIVKNINETMVYYFKSIRDIRRSNFYCNSVINDQLASLAFNNIYPHGEVLPRNDYDYKIYADEHNLTFHICEGEKKAVDLKKNLIKIDFGPCTYTKSMCVTTRETVLWNIDFEVISRAEGEIWSLGHYRDMKLLIFDDIRKTYILRLLTKIIFEDYDYFWVTNEERILVREVSSDQPKKDLSLLQNYLCSKFNNSKDDIIAPSIWSMNRITFYIFFLLVSLVSYHILSKVIGLIINIIILEKTRRDHAGTIWYYIFSQNLMIHHIQRCHIDSTNKTTVSSQNLIEKNHNSPAPLYEDVFEPKFALKSSNFSV